PRAAAIHPHVSRERKGKLEWATRAMSLSREGTLCHRRLRLRALSPASVGIRRFSPPDDHFTAGPDCRLTKSGSGSVGGAGGCPTIRARIVSTAGVQNAFVIPTIATPDADSTATADCTVIASCVRIDGGAGGCAMFP